MNLILAWLLISIGFAINLPTQIDSPSNPPPHAIMSNPQIAVGQIQSGSPAAAAGLQPDDIILKIDGQSYQDIQPAIDSGHISLGNVGGPVAIGKLVGRARQMGFITLLELTSFLSLNLAVLNILPFPALDGGRVLFLLIEKVRRKRNNQQVEQWFNTVGFVFLLLLMVLVTVHDIIRK